MAVGAATLGASTAAMLRGIEPFATWYYPFAWYSTLLVMDGVTGLRGGPMLLRSAPGHLATLLGWSAVTWLFFELVNFRLRNWYYVFVPDDRLARWAGVTLSFATVLPAVFVSEAMLESLGFAGGTRWPGLRVTRRRLRALQVAGLLMLVLPLAFPRLFFPLIWGGLALLLDPINYRRDRDCSLIGDLERGQPGRLLRLLAGGALIGLLWELFNIRARSKWIYTVPGLEELKLFEMPILGFLGFPPFTLECFAVWQALVLSGLAAPRTGPVRGASAAARVGAAGAAVLFSAGVLIGMERWTVSSYTPRLHQLPDVPAEALEAAGYDVFSLARARPEDVASSVGRHGGSESANPSSSVGGHDRSESADRRSPEASAGSGSPIAASPEAVNADRARRWIDTARLAALGGIGTENARRLMAVGVESVEELARSDPDLLVREIAARGDEVVPARVRVWVRAARREVGPASAGPAAELPSGARSDQGARVLL